MDRGYHAGWWSGLDQVLSLLNTIDVPENMTADQMRRNVYKQVHALRPKVDVNGK